jgi:hypothetical protein
MKFLVIRRHEDDLAPRVYIEEYKTEAQLVRSWGEPDLRTTMMVVPFDKVRVYDAHSHLRPVRDEDDREDVATNGR